MIIQYNGLVFKLGLIIEKDIAQYPEETRYAICWTLVKHWFSMLLARHSITSKTYIYEYTKMAISDRDELLRMTLADIFKVPDGKQYTYIETIN